MPAWACARDASLELTFDATAAGTRTRALPRRPAGDVRWAVSPCGCSSMVELQPSKLAMPVRSRSPARYEHAGQRRYWPRWALLSTALATGSMRACSSRCSVSRAVVSASADPPSLNSIPNSSAPRLPSRKRTSRPRMLPRQGAMAVGQSPEAARTGPSPRPRVAGSSSSGPYATTGFPTARRAETLAYETSPATLRTRRTSSTMSRPLT